MKLSKKNVISLIGYLLSIIGAVVVLLFGPWDSIFPELTKNLDNLLVMGFFLFFAGVGLINWGLIIDRKEIESKNE